MIKYLGGAQAAGILHRIAAIITFGYFAVHLAHAGPRPGSSRRSAGFFWGWRSMVPQPQDVAGLRRPT